MLPLVCKFAQNGTQKRLKNRGSGIKKKFFLEATFFVCFLHDLHGRFKDYLMIKRNTEITLIRRVDVFL